jgi:hypothetical protein
MIIACLTILAIIGLTYHYAGSIEKSLNLTKPALKLIIITNTNKLDGDRLEITNITFEQTEVPVFYRSADSPPEFPDISVQGKKGTITSAPITYWASAKRLKTDETYRFTLTFREPYVPKPEDLLILDIRMSDFRGELEYKTTAFYGWK